MSYSSSEPSTVSFAETGDEPRGFALVVVTGATATTLPLRAGGVVTVGRARGSHVQLEDPSISRRHAWLHVNSGVAVEDAGSVNGTYVAGVRLAPGVRRVARPGDALRFGNVAATLRALGTGTPLASSPKLRSGEWLIGDPTGGADDELARVAASSVHVVFVGEPGAGKTFAARQLHLASPRAAGPCVVVECSAIPESPGALARVVEAASRGTLVLRRLETLSPAMQSALVHVLDEQRLRRVRGVPVAPLDARIVFTASRQLHELSHESVVGEALQTRLSSAVIEVRPLRDRAFEIAAIALAHAERQARALRRDVMTLSPEAISALEGEPWHGNVRELLRVIEHAVRTAPGERVEFADLGFGAGRAVGPLSASRLHERARVEAALARHAGNQSAAARELGIARGTLVARLDEFGLTRPRKRSATSSQ